MNAVAIEPAGGGQRLDERYQLITQIGSGGMSVVWHAFDEVLERQVAVKLLAPSLGADPAFPRRLLTEARAVAALNHRHITGVHDFGVHRAAGGQCTPYLVMELLDGELLSDVLRRGPLPWRQAVTICAELASALQAAHDNGIVHRDVTPANVMLTSTGAKVLDFGISALIGDKETSANGDVFGTVAYLAPERLIRDEVTAAADVYAAGLVLYQCLAGRLPWPAETITEMLYAHAHVQPHPLPPLGLPRAIEDVCYQCLASEPHHRPSSAQLAQILSREAQRIDVATVRLGEIPGPPGAIDGEIPGRPGAIDGEMMTLPLVAVRRRYAPRRRVLVGAAALLGAVTLGYALPRTSPQPAAAQTDHVNASAECPPLTRCPTRQTIGLRRS
jgi:eukaryotic-like serine/threonine-protein kinase